jgi:DNA-binding IclR family transcriptional regulator
MRVFAMSEEESKGQPLVTGLLRGLSVLRCFDLGRERLGSSDIARLTGLPQPTVWRLCKTLEHGGYLIADTDGARWRPGLAILTLGFAALDTLELAELARPLLAEAAARFQGAVSLSTRDGVSMLYLQRCEAPGVTLTVNLRVGSEVPIVRSGTGWAFLAGRSAAERSAILKACRQADPALYARCEKPALAAIAEYGKAGFVTNADTFFTGMSTVAVPIADASTDAPYVINCTCATGGLASVATRKALGAALIRIADQLRPVVIRVERQK